MEIVSDAALRAARNFNETEIRFHIVDPIIRTLGYTSGDDVYLNLEEKLEYPYLHIGRRSKKDVPLGFPDYRAGLKGARGSFIIEAKAGDVPITAREIEQAHSYAAHAQVGANYFLLCNGCAIFLFETLSGPASAPLAEIPLTELNARFHLLENVLAPTNLAKNCRVEYDCRLRLTNGLGSIARIRAGHYKMSDYDYRFIMGGRDCTNLLRQSIPQFSELDDQLGLLKNIFELRVSSGVVRRGEDGRITAKVEFAGATIPNHKAMTLMGIEKAAFETADKFISTEENSPTIFESTNDFTISRGTNLPHFLGGSSSVEFDLAGDLFVRAALHYKEGEVCGEYVGLSTYDFTLPGSPPLRAEMSFAGTVGLLLGE